MAETEFIQSVPLVDPKTGLPTRTALQKLNGIQRGAFGAKGGLPGKAGLTQPASAHWLIETADNKTYRVIGNSAQAFTITGVSTVSSVGTCTVTVQINGTPLGGGANAASTTPQTKSHTSANEVAVGDAVSIVVSSNAGCEGLTVDIAGTMVLEP